MRVKKASLIEGSLLHIIKLTVYDPCNFIITNFTVGKEGREYSACEFSLNNKKVICRDAKITPKKIGQFVTFWQRNLEGVTVPFHQTQAIDCFIVNVKDQQSFGQFVFPISILIEKEIVTTNLKDGKRAFRVYPPWCNPQSKQAKRTQDWQLHFYLKIAQPLSFDRIKKLYADVLDEV